MKKENIFNLPNLLSFYRLLMFPVIQWSVFKNNLHLFTLLFCVNLVTDVLDGYIARRFNLATKFGAALDNLADFGTYILAVSGIYKFKWEYIESYSILLLGFLFVFLASNFIGWIKFRKMPGLHLYSCVVAGYLQGFFFFILFAFGFSHPLFFLSVGFGIASYIEKIFVLLYIKEIKPGLKGLYWIKKKGTDIL